MTLRTGFRNGSLLSPRSRERRLDRYRQILEAAGDPVYALDPEGYFLEANSAMSDLLDVPVDELVGTHVSEYISEADYRRGNEAIKSVLESDDDRKASYDITVSGDGKPTNLEITLSAMTDQEDEFQGSVGIIRDATARKHREQELEAYETIVETIPDGVFVLDDEGTIQRHNRRAAELIGHPGEDIQGTPFSQLVSEGIYPSVVVNEYAEIVEELRDSDDDVAEQLQPIDHPERGRRLYKSNIALLPFDDEFRGTTGTMRDVTERYRDQKRLENQNQQLEDFARVLAHDLRNPLHVILSRSKLLEETDGTRDHVDAIVRSAERMNAIVKDVLTVVRHGKSIEETEPVRLSDAVGAAWASVESPEARITVEPDGTVDADPERLTTLFEKLLHNAVEHGGDDVTVRAGLLTDDCSTGFYVEDDGKGIPEEKVDSIFASNYSTKQSETGLGLVVVRQIATAHGWSVSVTESDPGGARFEFVQDAEIVVDDIVGSEDVLGER
jgi:PAS domain S-box-containing protein